MMGPLDICYIFEFYMCHTSDTHSRLQVFASVFVVQRPVPLAGETIGAWLPILEACTHTDADDDDDDE